MAFSASPSRALGADSAAQSSSAIIPDLGNRGLEGGRRHGPVSLQTSVSWPTLPASGSPELATALLENHGCVLRFAGARVAS